MGLSLRLHDIWCGFTTSPFHHLKITVLLTVAYILLAIPIGFYAGLFSPGLLQSELIYLLPFTLLVFPAFLEEAFFRGLIIPRDAASRGAGYIVYISLLSSILFVIWHPLNALTINPTARDIFTNAYFLIIVFCLGMGCSLAYIYSRSLWVPVILHWLTVVIWVLFLGGRNLVLE